MALRRDAAQVQVEPANVARGGAAGERVPAAAEAAGRDARAGRGHPVPLQRHLALHDGGVLRRLPARSQRLPTGYVVRVVVSSCRTNLHRGDDSVCRFWASLVNDEEAEGGLKG